MAWNQIVCPSPNVKRMNSKNLDEQLLPVPPPIRAADGKSPACGVVSPKRPLSSSCDQQEDMVEEDMNEEGLHQAEKKRRLTSDQVKFLELSFEMENKLEPERKLLIAKQLGLQPRQVAVWFQNRRARWKTKQLERDFDALKASYDTILKENEKLQAEVASLNALLNGLNAKKCCAQAEGFESAVTQEEAAPVLPAVSVYPCSIEQSVDKVQDLSSKSEVDSPTKSDQSEVLDSVYYIPASDSPLLRMIEDSAAAVYSDGLWESMYNPLLLQQVAVKLEGSVFQEENCNLIFSWEEHGLLPWYD